jgi:predicted nucleic acid-binding protein
MIVVSNTSPVLNLGIINQLDILEKLYQKILIPELVYQELWKYSLKGKLLPSLISGWIETQTVINQSLVNSLLLELDIGEAEAIALAVEKKSDILLIDERRGDKVASRFGLNRTGVLGVLIEAKQKGFITEVRPIMDDLRIQAGFWIRDDLYDYVLTIVAE